jgi:hypothetical protein
MERGPYSARLFSIDERSGRDASSLNSRPAQKFYEKYAFIGYIEPLKSLASIRRFNAGVKDSIG